MEEIFKIGDHDYSDYLESGGYALSKEERGKVRITNLGGTDRKFRRSVKDVVRVTFTMMPDSLRKQLENDTEPVSFQVTYMGRSGVAVRRCGTDTGVVATLGQQLDDGLYWGTVQLEVYEL